MGDAKEEEEDRFHMREEEDEAKEGVGVKVGNEVQVIGSEQGGGTSLDIRKEYLGHGAWSRR